MRQIIEIMKDTIIALQQTHIMQLRSELRNKEILERLERMTKA